VSRIAELGEQIEEAAEYALWAADDARDNHMANLCRNQTADLFRTFPSDAENSKD
jgi:hypothetical protein